AFVTAAENAAEYFANALNDFGGSFADFLPDFFRRLDRRLFDGIGNSETVEGAVLGWGCARDEHFFKRMLARGIRELETLRVNAREFNAGRRIEMHLVRIFRRIQFRRLQHEFGPNRQGETSAFEIKVAVIVIANPRDHENVFRISGEPAVA